jgi:predicted transcriptional regulator of viral defense system
MYVAIDDRILVELHRAARLAGRPGVVIPSEDLRATKQQNGDQRVRNALRRLVSSGRAVSVRQDLLILPDDTGLVRVGVAEIIDAVAPTPYLITGARALEAHYLTDQHSFSIVTLVPRRTREFTFRGERAVFVTTRTARIWGWADEGPRVALPERALLDAVASAHNGVPLWMAVAALHTVTQRDMGFVDRLAAAATRYDSAAVSRRLGLLVESACGPEAAEPFHDLIGKSRTPVLLRAGGVQRGEVDPTWRVVVNASTQREDEL